MQPFLALITPIGNAGGGGPVDPGYSPPWAQVPGGGGGQPPGIWGPTDPRPTNPIAGWDPGSGTFPPGRPPGVPTHPVYNPPYPDNSLPGQQPGIWGPTDPRPTPPIYIPPAGAEPPLGIWGPTDPRPGLGPVAPQPHPEHPIVLPPDLPPTTPEGGRIEWKTAWTPVTGWIVVGIPQEPHPVPSAA